MSLYEIDKAYHGIMLSVEEADGEITEEQIKQLDELETQFEDKADNICKFIKNLEVEKSGYDEELKRLRARSSSLGTHIKSLKTYLKGSMESRDLTKLETSSGLFKIGIQNSPFTVEWQGDNGNIPVPYRKPVEFSATEVLRARKEGRLIGDKWEFKQGKHIRIR